MTLTEDREPVLMEQIAPWSYHSDYIDQFFVRRNFLAAVVRKMILSHVETQEWEKVENAPSIIEIYPEEFDLIYQHYTDGLADANTAWDFAISGWYGPLTVLKYDRGSKEDWHTYYTQTDRTKIGFVTLLNTPGEDYVGGDFEILKRGAVNLKKPGDTVFFPGYLTHRVKPIKSGSRIVLAGCVGGPSWK